MMTAEEQEAASKCSLITEYTMSNKAGFYHAFCFYKV